VSKATGFASPAQGYEEQGIDFNRLLVQNPPATYFFRLEASGMEEFGLLPGSILVVDRSRSPDDKSIALIRHDGQFLCRLFCKGETSASYFTNGKDIIYPAAGETELIGTVIASVKIYGTAALP
jgi:DNA polymerase V